MISSLRSLLVATAFVGGIFSTLSAAEARSRADLEAATRLQVFLDRAEFAPGKIDGRYGEFTMKAVALYRRARGGPEAPTLEKNETKKAAAPDVSDLDLTSIEPLFLSYTVTDLDLKNIGELLGT